MLQLMALGIQDVMNFDFMSKPSPGKMQQVMSWKAFSGPACKLQFHHTVADAIRSAVEHLELLGAVERNNGQVLLTALGKKMSSFPLEPRYAKVVLFEMFYTTKGWVFEVTYKRLPVYLI